MEGISKRLENPSPPPANEFFVVVVPPEDPDAVRKRDDASIGGVALRGGRSIAQSGDGTEGRITSRYVPEQFH